MNLFCVSTETTGIETIKVIDIEIFTGYGWGLISQFRNTLYAAFNRSWEILLDDTKRFAISINFNPDSNNFLQNSQIMSLNTIMRALNNISVDNSYLCIFTKNKLFFIARPTYNSSQIPLNHIAGITAAYYLSNRQIIISSTSFAAFGCGSEVNDRTDDLIFIEENNRGFNFIWTVEYVNSSIFIFDDFNEFEKKDKFSIHPVDSINLIDIRDNFELNEKNMFLAPSNTLRDVCPDGREQLTQVSIYGMLQSVILCSEEIFRGVHLRSCVSSGSLTSCR